MSKSNEKKTSTTVSDFKQAVGVLSSVDKRKLSFVVILQVFLGALDLLGVLAIGLLGTLSVTGIQSKVPGDRVNRVLSILQI